MRRNLHVRLPRVLWRQELRALHSDLEGAVRSSRRVKRGGGRNVGTKRTILGVSADYHDAAACLLLDGRVVFAAEEERFSRVKHDPRLPRTAIWHCMEHLRTAGLELDAVAFHEKPFTRYERILLGHAESGPRSLPQLARSIATWSRHKLWVAARLERLLDELGHAVPETVFVEHHLSHAAAAYFASPYEHAAVLTVDGVGEFATASISIGSGRSIEMLRQMDYPGSLGLFYSSMTAYCGFDVNDGEYKLMGLAPLGRPDRIDDLLDGPVRLHEDGALQLDPRYFDVGSGRFPVRPRLQRLLGGRPRRPDEPITHHHADIAASTQRITELAIERMAATAVSVTGSSVLCLGGGVAANCAANGHLQRSSVVEATWVPPAPGDAGNAIGAALWTWHQLWERDRGDEPPHSRSTALLGPSFDDEEVRTWLTECGVSHTLLEDSSLSAIVAEKLASGAIIGRCCGPMEFGPRALGNRSILADPRRASMRDRLNRLVKGRESFRPFAPAVMAERAHEWFDLSGTNGEFPHMTHTVPVLHHRPSSRSATQNREVEWQVDSPLPACTHVDGTARLQTVSRFDNPGFHALLDAFHRLTGCPVLVNTSFNRAGEPIVCTPADALRCFASADLDLLVIGHIVVTRDDLPTMLAA